MSDFKRQHPVAAITRVMAIIRQNLITIIILLFIGTSNSEGYFLYFLLGGLGIALVGGVFGWWVFMYRVHEDELQIKKGILVKNKLFLSKDRIQVIDITEGILQRLFGLVKVEVKTAGGGTETATISAITREEAEALRTELRKKNNQDSSNEGASSVADKEEEEITGEWKLSNRDLVFAAFTSGNFGLIASILGAISGQMDEFINEERIEYLMEILPGFNNLTLIVGIILVILVISWMLSFLGVIFRYSDFRIQKTDKELIITSGLLERKHITVPFDRIQAVRFVEGLLRQPFGYGMLYVESAGFDQTQQGRSIVLVPFMGKHNVNTFLDEFLEEYKQPDYQIRPGKEVLWRYIRRPNYFLLPLIPLAWYLMEYGWLSLLLVPLFTYLGWLRFKDAAVALGENILGMRYRVVSRTTAFIKRNRIQNIELTGNPFQRRRDIRNIIVTAASGAGGMNFEVADIHTSQSFETYSWVVQETKDTVNETDDPDTSSFLAEPNSDF